MKIAYVCPNGHIAIGEKEDHLQGLICEGMKCLKCDLLAYQFKEHTMTNKAKKHFDFYRPKFGEVVTQEDQKILDDGYLLLKISEDPEIEKEFTATLGMSEIAKFLLQHTKPEERLEDIADTAIKFLKIHFEMVQAVRSLGRAEINKN